MATISNKTIDKTLSIKTESRNSSQKIVRPFTFMTRTPKLRSHSMTNTDCPYRLHVPYVLKSNIRPV